MEDRNRYSSDYSYHKRSNHGQSDSYHDRKGYEREDRRDTKYDRKDDRGYNKFFKNDSDYKYQGFKSNITDSKDQLVRIEKNFYKESESVKKRTPEDVKAFRDASRIVIKTEYAPNPITTFEESSFPSYILEAIKLKGFQKPTAIQSQGWPIVLKGHDLIGIAQTGSGKTLAFLLPGIVHMKAQEPLRRGDGPIGLVLAPTRELAMQIYEEFRPFSSSARLKATCIYGGADRYPQKRDLRSGCELVIATPGRLIDFLESGDTNLKRVSFLVIDEADRMLDMGFIPQIEKIVEYIRKDRQTLMWSATWPREVRRLAEDLCKEKPVHIVVGNDDLAVNKAVTQLVKVVAPREKFDKLLRLVRGIYDGSKILIFCQTKKNSDWVSRTLQNEGFRAVSIHGDKSQKDRDKIMSLFKDERVPILVATNLAARGLDVKDIRYVINYDFPTQMEEYVHRVGRTGRAGAVGTSFTFFTDQDAKFARDLIKILNDNGQRIPDELWDFVNDRRFKDKILRYEKNYTSGSRDTKDFSDYEKAQPVYNHPRNTSYTSSNNEESSNSATIRRSNIPSRSYVPNFYNNNMNNAAPPSTYQHMYSTPQQMGNQQYQNGFNMPFFVPMQMMQNFPTLAQTNTFTAPTGQAGPSQPSQVTGQPSTDIKPPTEDKKDLSYNAGDGSNDVKSSQEKGTADDYSSKKDYDNSTNTNGKGYYRDNNSHGNSYYSSPKPTSPSSAGGITRSNFKRINGSRFSDAKPAEDNKADDSNLHPIAENGESANRNVVVEQISFQNPTLGQQNEQN